MANVKVCVLWQKVLVLTPASGVFTVASKVKRTKLLQPGAVGGDRGGRRTAVVVAVVVAGCLVDAGSATTSPQHNNNNDNKNV